MEERNESEVDMLELFRYLKKKIALILVVTVLFTAMGYLGTKLFGKPVYQASITLYFQTNISGSGLNYTDMQVATLLTRDGMNLIKSRSITDQVIRELRLDMTHEALCKKIDIIEPETATRVMTLTVTDGDPQQAADIANAIGKYATQTIKSIMAVDAVKIVDSAIVPEKPVGPSSTRNGILFGAGAMMATVGVLCVMQVMSRTIRTEEDVERYLKLSVMGTIPVIPGTEKRTQMKRLTKLWGKPKQARK